MEKRLKHIFGLLIVGVGLLFSQTFGTNQIVVEGVTLPQVDNFQNVSDYKYSFNNNYISNANTYYGWLGYSLFYNGSYQYNIESQVSNDYGCPTIYSGLAFNYSLTGYIPGYSDCVGVWQNIAHFTRYYSYNYTNTGFNSDLGVYLGNGDEFGKNFITLGNLGTNKFPVYSLGNKFYTNLNSYYLKSDVLGQSPLRLFFRQNVNLSSPLDGYNLIDGSGSNASGSIAWQYFTYNNAVYRTKYQSSNKYIIDYGREGIKGVHFGGYGMGYTYGVNLALNQNELYRGNWSFGTIGSRCIESAMQLGVADFDTLTSSACSNLGLLVLKGESYTDRNNNASVIILGKNPNNTKQILYQQFDCAEDDLLRVMSSGENAGFCNPISNGFITHNGSGDILPFSDKMSMYTLGSGNEFLDFFFKGGLYGYTSISGNNYCLTKQYLPFSSSQYYSSSTYCFGLTATPNLKSLKEMYLENGGDLAGNGGTVGGEGLDDIIINEPDWFYNYTGLVEYTMSGDFYVEEDSGYIDNYTEYTFINGVPQLKNLKFGVCPFVTNSNFATLGMQDFSFDMLVPHKCILAGLQAGYTSVNMSGFSDIGFSGHFINETLNNENAGLIGHFVAIIIILGVTAFVFYFLKPFK